MTRFLSALILAGLVSALLLPGRADDTKDATAVLDKAIKALGGEEKLGGDKAFTWKGKGKINIMGNDNEFTSQATFQGLDHYRGEFEGEFGGNKIKGITVVNGDKGWRKFGDMGMELDKEGVANEKRNVYLQEVPALIVPLRSKGFKVEGTKEDKVGDKAAIAVKAKGPDSKEFTLYLDKESGLPLRQVAKVVGFDGNEFTQDTTYSDYKDFGGIKKATKVESKREGEKFIELEITEFKVLDKVDPKTFDEPQ